MSSVAGYSSYCSAPLEVVKRGYHRLGVSSWRSKALVAAACAAACFATLPFGLATAIAATLSGIFGYSYLSQKTYVPFLSARPLTDAEQSKVEMLRKDPNVVGISWVWDRNAWSWEPVYIKKDDNSTRGPYDIYLVNSDEQLGLSLTSKTDSKSIPLINGDPGGYGSTLEKVNRVAVTSINTEKGRERYKFAGYLLIKAIEEDTRSFSNSCIFLQSAGDAIGFYQKLGFVKLPGDKKTYPYMYLPQDSRREWQAFSPFIR